MIILTLSCAAPAASASTRVRVDAATEPDTLYYEEAPGSDERSSLLIDGFDGGVTLTEQGGVTIETPVGLNCSGGGFQVTCSLADRVLQVNGEDLADVISAAGSVGVRIDGGAGPDTLTGTSLTGSSDPDVINGGDGADILDGRLNSDILDGGAGDDLLIGPPVFDTGEVLNGGTGIDTVDYTTSNAFEVNVSMDGVQQPGEKDNIGSDVENVNGTDYADTIVGNANANVLDGGRGSCSDVISGGSGNDTVSFATHQWAVHVSLDGVANDGGSGFEQFCGPEVEQIAPDIESVRGSPFDDVLLGNATGNVLDGGAGDDRLDPGAGTDTIVGGSGSDEADYGVRAAPVQLTLDAVANDGNSDDGPPGGRDLIVEDVERLTGVFAADTLTGNGQANVLDGGPGDDIMQGLGGVDTVDYSSRSTAVIVDLGDTAPTDGAPDESDTVNQDVESVLGGGGDDVLVGSSDVNTLSGGGGDDELDGDGGADALFGDAGVDLASYEQRSARVVADLDGQPSDDGEAGEGDTLGSDLEGLLGGAGPDRLEGNAESNWFDGGTGGDEFIGGAGYDIVSYAARTGGVIADPDGVIGDDGQPGEGDTIAGDVEDLAGGSGQDAMTGNAADNLLFGGPGADRLDGAGGEDALYGEDADDELVSRDDQADLADCGADDDLVRPDALDELVACERRDDSPGSAPDPLPPAAPAPSAPAPFAPAPSGGARDVTPATVRARLRTTRLKRAVTEGVRFAVNCSEPCTLRGRLLITRRLAGQLHLPSRVIGKGQGRAVTSQTTLVVRFTTTARRRLKRRHSLRATLELLATDAAGNTRRLRQTVSLR